MLGAAFKVTAPWGCRALPMKGDYARHDWARIARLKNLPLVYHPEHPITQLPATRAFYWIERETPHTLQRLRQGRVRRLFRRRPRLARPEAVAELAKPLWHRYQSSCCSA